MVRIKSTQRYELNPYVRYEFSPSFNSTKKQFLIQKNYDIGTNASIDYRTYVD